MSVERAEKALEKATAAYRSKPTAANKAAYRKASEDLVDARQTERLDRPLGVGGDAVKEN